MNSTTTTRLFITIVTACLLATAFQAHAQDSQSVFEYSTSPDNLIISYSETPEMLGNPDLTPRIQVFGDGWVWVHYPEYMKKAGDYELYLNQGELRQLLVAMSGVFDFDPEAASQTKKAVTQARELAEGILSYRSEDTLETFVIKVDSFRATPSASARNIDLNLKWNNDFTGHSDYPEVPGLQKLAVARQSIRALLERTDLVGLNSTSPAK